MLITKKQARRVFYKHGEHTGFSFSAVKRDVKRGIFREVILRGRYGDTLCFSPRGEVYIQLYGPFDRDGREYLV